MNKTLFSKLCDLIATGYRFKQEDIAVIQDSIGYHQSSSAEQIFIDGLVKNFAELPSTAPLPSVPSRPPWLDSPST